MNRTYVLIFMLMFVLNVEAKTLTVGPGQDYARIEAAYEAAASHDVIEIYPKVGNAPYEKVALLVKKSNLTFIGMNDAFGELVKVSGKGFDYSGRGSTPRAIFQVNPGGDYAMIKRLELSGASNQSHNGAGVRVNQANHVVITECHIHGNDMGIMSSGNGEVGVMSNLQIKHCEIHHNGNREDPGYNHNLYLGGTSNFIMGCKIYASLTGHNLKSRSHVNVIVGNYIYHSANREIDLVDAKDTGRAGSDSLVIGNVIVKHPEAKGNRTVIHFGQDGGRAHRGTLLVQNNTIVTPFVSPVVDLSTPGARAVLNSNVIFRGKSNQHNQKLLNVRNGAKAEHVGGSHNWLSASFKKNAEGIRLVGSVFGEQKRLPFRELGAGDVVLTERVEGITGNGLGWGKEHWAEVKLFKGAYLKRAYGPERKVVERKDDANAPSRGAGDTMVE